MAQPAKQFFDKTIDDLSLLSRWASIALRDQFAEIQKDVPVLVCYPMKFDVGLTTNKVSSPTPKIEIIWHPLQILCFTIRKTWKNGNLK